jgi:hypothetical protein
MFNKWNVYKTSDEAYVVARRTLPWFALKFLARDGYSHWSNDAQVFQYCECNTFEEAKQLQEVANKKILETKKYIKKYTKLQF